MQIKNVVYWYNAMQETNTKHVKKVREMHPTYHVIFNHQNIIYDILKYQYIIYDILKHHNIKGYI